MYIANSNQYAIELVTYLLVLLVYFYEFIVYMVLEKNASDSIAFFSQCMKNIRTVDKDFLYLFNKNSEYEFQFLPKVKLKEFVI